MKKLLAVCLTVLMMAFLLSGCGETATPSTSPAEDFLYRENEDGTIAVSWYNGEDAHVVIPGTIDGKTVTAIHAGAFANITPNDDGKEETPDEEVLELDEPGSDGDGPGGADLASERYHRRGKLV